MSVINTHAAVVLEQASEQPGRDSDLHDRPAASPDRPTLGERLGEVVPLISAPAFFGPPVIFLLGAWLLLVLLLIPPAALRSPWWSFPSSAQGFSSRSAP